ncbi:MAG TPA: alanine racemase [Candidatus Cloacimonadota bacterium]|nr:alanine racemase [Candidatus Cloacimonadota bacterium]HPM01645.1 alanine racemase [Candidatus Cloacimonadota bacterium]
MAFIEIHIKRILENIQKLNDLLHSKGKSWTLVQKILGSNNEVITELLKSDLLESLHSIGDSHLSGLKAVKKINPHMKTLYIKPPALAYIEEVVKYADISINTALNTIYALNKEAHKQNKIHKIIIMIEMGELREGVLRDQVLNFYKSVFELPNIEVIGLGTNLGCMFGVQPTFDKLLQLSLYKQLIEVSFQQRLEIISGASSITLPLLLEDKIPSEINHFRLGEAPFLGISPYNNTAFEDLNTKTFEFNSYIVELKKKENEPDGILGDSKVGTTNDITKNKPSFKAIVDFGSLDVDPGYLTTLKDNVSFFGNSSDMTVYDLENNDLNLKEGDTIAFIPNYMGVANLMNSRFVDKKIII